MIIDPGATFDSDDVKQQAKRTRRKEPESWWEDYVFAFALLALIALVVRACTG
jgi:hypothetical protein